MAFWSTPRCRQRPPRQRRTLERPLTSGDCRTRGALNPLRRPDPRNRSAMDRSFVSNPIFQHTSPRRVWATRSESDMAVLDASRPSYASLAFVSATLPLMISSALSSCLSTNGPAACRRDFALAVGLALVFRDLRRAFGFVLRLLSAWPSAPRARRQASCGGPWRRIPGRDRAGRRTSG